MTDQPEILTCPECDQPTLTFKTLHRKIVSTSVWGSIVPIQKSIPDYEEFHCENPDCGHTDYFSVDPHL